MKITRSLAGLSLAALLSACGGGGGGDSTAVASATGLFNGTTTSGRSVTGVVLGDGTYYVLYSTTTNPNVIGGVVQGSGTTSANSFTSSNAKDFNLEGLGALNATVAANFVTKTSLSGSVTYSAPGITETSFTTTYNADFEVAPSLSTIAGTYTGQALVSAGSQAATVTISATGALSGSGASGCALTGTVSPRSDGNVYDFSMTFGSTNCVFANQTFTGISYYNSVTKKIIAAAPNATRTDGALFVGTKP